MPEYENEFGSSSNSASMVQIDVRDLELDPIVFEPLPTLTPLQLKIGETASHAVAESSNIAPYSANESSIYAHDWFGKKTNNISLFKSITQIIIVVQNLDEPFSNFPRGNLEYIKIIGHGWFGNVRSILL